MNNIEHHESLVNGTELSSFERRHIYLPSILRLLTLLVILSLVSCSSSSNEEAMPTGPTNCTYTYSEWSACANGKQTRTVTGTTPDGCTGTPILEQTCEMGACTYTYSEWSACSSGKQTRTVTKAEPEGCAGTPVLEQACEVVNLPPSAVTFTGATLAVVPCAFTIVLSATDSDGNVSGFIQTDGSLPPNHSLAGNAINGASFMVAPLTEPSWTASFAAVDNNGLQGPASSVTLRCHGPGPGPE